MAKRNTRAVAAGAAVAAGGALAAGKVVHDLVTERAERSRARRYRLERDESPREGITRITRGQLELAIALIEGREGEGPKAIHEARKTLKRLRAVLRLCRGYLGKERFRQENIILRDAGRALSGARDAQVLIETLDGLREPLAEELPDGIWSRFRETLIADARALGEADDSERANVVSALEGIRARVELWELPDDGGPEALAPGLQRIYANARRARRRARDHTAPETLHELRKRTKDLWHSAQLLDQVCPKRIAKLRRRAHKLADVLGEDHDLAVLMDHAGARPEAFESGEFELLRALIERRRRVLGADALARAGTLYRRKPRKLLRRLALA
jgi:CHAD domain-containing protein